MRTAATLRRDNDEELLRLQRSSVRRERAIVVGARQAGTGRLALEIT